MYIICRGAGKFMLISQGGIVFFARATYLPEKWRGFGSGSINSLSVDADTDTGISPARKDESADWEPTCLEDLQAMCICFFFLFFS